MWGGDTYTNDGNGVCVTFGAMLLCGHAIEERGFGGVAVGICDIKCTYIFVLVGLTLIHLNAHYIHKDELNNLKWVPSDSDKRPFHHML